MHFAVDVNQPSHKWQGNKQQDDSQDKAEPPEITVQLKISRIIVVGQGYKDHGGYDENAELVDNLKVFEHGHRFRICVIHKGRCSFQEAFPENRNGNANTQRQE